MVPKFSESLIFFQIIFLNFLIKILKHLFNFSFFILNGLIIFYEINANL
jgi:hypothetical protein